MKSAGKLRNARLLVNLLRRHVERGANVGVREERLFAQHAGKAEVAELYRAIAVDEYVGGLDVAVQDLLGPRVAVEQRQQQLETHVPHLLLEEARAGLAVAANLAPQVAALAELHDDPYLRRLLVDHPAAARL
jgi:hypothetical protein